MPLWRLKGSAIHCHSLSQHASEVVAWLVLFLTSLNECYCWSLWEKQSRWQCRKNNKRWKHAYTIWPMCCELRFQALKILCCVSVLVVVVWKVTDSNGISERFCNGANWCMASTPLRAAQTRRHAEWNMSANWCHPPFPSVLYVSVSVCVCVCVVVLRLAHFVPVTHLISQTFDAECKRDTYWHIIRSEQCVLLQLITVSATQTDLVRLQLRL